jgi:hypothetical protein
MLLEHMPKVDLLGCDVSGSSDSILAIVKGGLAKFPPGNLQHAVRLFIATVGMSGPCSASLLGFSVDK